MKRAEWDYEITAYYKAGTMRKTRHGNKVNVGGKVAMRTVHKSESSRDIELTAWKSRKNADDYEVVVRDVPRA